MIAHLTAFQAALETLGRPVHIVAAPVVTGQYFVISSKSWDAPLEVPVCDDDESFDTEVRLTAVTGTPDGALIMLTNARHLFPTWTPLTVAGRVVRIRWERSEFVGIDRDVVLTSSNRNPAVGVDTYRLNSQPA